MISSLPGFVRSWTFLFLLIAAGLIVISNVPGRGKALAQKEKPVHTSEDRANDVTNLKAAFGAAQVDLFFEMGELESLKPGLSGVKFVDVVDVTGKELLHFERSGDSWLIDPDTVFAYKMHKGK